MLQSFVSFLWEMITHLIFILYRFKPKIRLINASAQGPVWEEHHSFWTQLEQDCLSGFILPYNCHSFLPFPSWTSCSLSDELYSISTKEERRETFCFCIYSQLQNVSVMDRTLVSPRYALAMHHRTEKKHIWNGMLLPKGIHQKQSYLGLAQEGC